MTYPVASLTLDSARSYVMQGTPFTQGMISSIPIVGNISLEGFLFLIMLLVVIIVMVVIVAVILVIVIVAIVRVVIVVTIIGVVVVVMIIGVVVVIGVFAIIKLLFVIAGFLHIIMLCYLIHQSLGYVNGFFQSLSTRTILIGQVPFQFSPGDLVSLLYSNRFGIGIPLGQGILCESSSRKFHFAVLGIVAMRKYRFSSFKPMNETNSSLCTIEVKRLAAHKLLSGGGVVDLTGDKDPIDKDGDTGVGDSKVSVSSGEISPGGRKSQEPNIDDSDNIGDEGKIVGGAIGACSGGIDYSRDVVARRTSMAGKSSYS
uniref:Uncharacterized protein n=1 Tax=Tanacetum cinerariifolium TaxID=118510 RepID=A0A6L2M7E9_TANCI|nr:hypothetical protein [Tanacetum cinerariifolium]